VSDFCNLSKLGVPVGGSYRVSEVIEDVNCMSYQNTISYYDGFCRPNTSFLSDKAPIADLYLAVAIKNSQLSLNDTVTTNHNSFTVTYNVSDAGSTA